MYNQNPEQIARDQIDSMLDAGYYTAHTQGEDQHE